MCSLASPGELKKNTKKTIKVQVRHTTGDADDFKHSVYLSLWYNHNHLKLIYLFDTSSSNSSKRKDKLKNNSWSIDVFCMIKMQKSHFSIKYLFYPPTPPPIKDQWDYLFNRGYFRS